MDQSYEIEIKNLKKTYRPGLFKKPIQAVKGVDLSVSKGEVFGLVGPNGAGKSSTIRLLLGLSRPDSGLVLFRGRPTSGRGFLATVGYLPENPYLYDHLTLDELLDFGERMSGISNAGSAERIKTLLVKTGLLQDRSRPLRSFSKGMKQRAGLCFALVHDPTVVILDEPMSGLDPCGRQLVFDLIGDLAKEGKTILFCSHILSDVERLCDRVGLMIEGRIHSLFTRPELVSANRGEATLQLPHLPAELVERLVSRGWLVDDSCEVVLLTLPVDELELALQKLSMWQVPVLGTASGGTPLERMFFEATRVEGVGKS